MGSTKRNKQSNRLLVPRLAAHVVHLLNEGEGIVELRSFALFQTLLQTLASEKYREGLVSAGVIGLLGEPELAAQKYFEAVFERPLFLARANPLHKGHELFAALCQRGASGGWELCEIVRHNPKPRDNSDRAPEGFSSVCDRLGKLDRTIDKSNPALKTRQTLGPLFLVAPEASAEVAEQMSVWGAISCGPLKLNRLEDKKQFDAFCSLMIKALETANAPYGAFISLGLSPFDWGEDITTNTARMALRFVNEARALAEEQGIDGHDLALWQQLWTKRKVPGYKSADELWNSAFGRALRHPLFPQFAQVDEFVDHEAEDKDAPLMEPQDYVQALSYCEDNNLLSSFDRWFLQSLAHGETVAELKAHEKVREHFGGPVADERIETYVDDLYERLLLNAASQFEGD